MKYLKFTILIIIIFLIYGEVIKVEAKLLRFARENWRSLASTLSGQILLQVESAGEAWYINPADSKKYYLGKPQDAYNLMRNLGTGITNEDLKKIPIGNLQNMPDNDNDGLSNATEVAIGTNPNNPDTDDDGFLDGIEIEKNYNPLNNQKIKIDPKLVKNNLGKIFLQVEDKGQAWYLDPKSQKRFFLGRPYSAFQLMRELSIGITNSNLAKIDTGVLQTKKIKKQFIASPQKPPISKPPVSTPVTTPSPVQTHSDENNIIYNAASAIRLGETSQALPYFIPELHKSVEYTMDILGSEGRLILGNILSSVQLEISDSNKKIYSTQVYFGLGGYKVPVNFYVKKQENGEWLMTNI